MAEQKKKTRELDKHDAIVVESLRRQVAEIERGTKLPPLKPDTTADTPRGLTHMLTWCIVVMMKGNMARWN